MCVWKSKKEEQRQMYAETGLTYPYFHNFPQEVQQIDDLFCSHKTNASVGMHGNLNQGSFISDYNLGEEGDLFKAPEPIVEEPIMCLDPVTAALSMISCGEDVTSPQALTVSDIASSIDNGQLLSEVFYECKKDLLAKEGNEVPLSEVETFKIPDLKTDEKLIAEEKFQRSVSSSCLRSMDLMNGAPLSRPSFVDFTCMDFEAAYGMRRSLSEGDIKTLGNGDIKIVQPTMEPSNIMTSCIAEDRREKLSRYRIKKSKRNFGRKIKYACRKALADSQPRIRGRFAKTEEVDSSKKQ